MAPSTRPLPTTILHFTHRAHLATIVRDGLVAYTAAHEPGLLQIEVGNREIKARRRTRAVPLAPGGVVADYVPFYFAPRSPMMYVIERGGVAGYEEGCNDIVYLVTSVDRVVGYGAEVLFTDRNAVLAIAEFTGDVGALDHLIDWDLMRSRMWNDVADYPDRKERRMAECLVHAGVPWTAITEVVTGNVACGDRARALLDTLGSPTPVTVRPDWYF